MLQLYLKIQIYECSFETKRKTSMHRDTIQ